MRKEHILIIDGKKLTLDEIKYPFWVESSIELKNPEGNFKIIGREMQVITENYPLLDQ